MDSARVKRLLWYEVWGSLELLAIVFGVGVTCGGAIGSELIAPAAFVGSLFWLAGAACLDTARAYGPGARHFAGTPELIAALHEAPACASVLVKGSRFMAMERVVRALVPQEGASHAH